MDSRNLVLENKLHTALEAIHYENGGGPTDKTVITMLTEYELRRLIAALGTLDLVQDFFDGVKEQQS